MTRKPERLRRMYLPVSLGLNPNAIDQEELVFLSKGESLAATEGKYEQDTNSSEVKHIGCNDT